jgi:hypothetical protein
MYAAKALAGDGLDSPITAIFWSGYSAADEQGKCDARSTFGSAPYIGPQDVRQYLYRMSPKAGEERNAQVRNRIGVLLTLHFDWVSRSPLFTHIHRMRDGAVCGVGGQARHHVANQHGRDGPPADEPAAPQGKRVG